MQAISHKLHLKFRTTVATIKLSSHLYEKQKRRERKEHIQAADRREEERQAGCHTSKTGAQLQQAADVTAWRGGEKQKEV